MPEWDPEIAVDEALARRLIADQFPELRGASVRPLAAGLGQHRLRRRRGWAFRFPRRAIAIPGVEREMRAPSCACRLRLPVPIPVPRHLGAPSPAFGWPFFGARLLAGSEPTIAVRRCRPGAPRGPDSARFLRALHAPRAGRRPAPRPDGQGRHGAARTLRPRATCRAGGERPGRPSGRGGGRSFGPRATLPPSPRRVTRPWRPPLPPRPRRRGADPNR